MKLTPIEKKRVPIGKGRSVEYRELIDEFLSSEMESARIDELGELKVESLYTGLKNYIGKSNSHCRVVKAGRAVYLVRI